MRFCSSETVAKIYKMVRSGTDVSKNNRFGEWQKPPKKICSLHSAMKFFIEKTMNCQASRERPRMYYFKMKLIPPRMPSAFPEK